MSLDGVDLRRLTSYEDIPAFMEWLARPRQVLAVDTETTGLQWWTPGFLRTVQFGDTAGAWVVSARQWRGVIEEALDRYRTSGRVMVMHNAKFDMHALDSAGFELPHWYSIHDTQILDHLNDPILPHSLKSIAERYWPGSNRGQGLLHARMRENGWTWATVPEEEVSYWAYAALDTVLTARVFELHDDLATSAAYDRELAAAGILFGAEKRGLRVDIDYTEKLGAEWYLEMEELSAELEQYGVKNPNANREIAAALVDKESWSPDEWTPTGEPAMTEKILRKLPSEIAPMVLRYRRLRKWTSAYLSTFLNDKDSNGLLHPNIRTLQARTGRMSITDPALQTLPRGSEIRDCILPSGDDRALLAVDYDGQELRVFASYAQEEALIQALAEGLDPHRFAASRVYGIPEESVTPAQRQLSKNTFYGLIYGAGPAKIAETAGVPEGEARAFIDTLTRQFPGIRRLQTNVERAARSRHAESGEAYVTSWGGRKLKSEPDKTYALVNYLIQGGCADLLKSKIVDLDNAGFGDMIALPVHDELLFDVPGAPGEFEECRDEIAAIMHEPDAFAVPLTVHPSGPLTRWGDVSR